MNDTASEVVELFGKKRPHANIYATKMPEIKDVPSNMRVTIFGIGSLLGEEDSINKTNYTCTLKCHSLKGTLYSINKQDFLGIRH